MRRSQPSWWRLLKKAAERQGLTVADFVADTMTAEAQRMLKGQATEGTAVSARSEDVADRLAERLADELAR